MPVGLRTPLGTTAPARLPFRLGGRLLGAVFGTLTAARGPKPLHPRGVLLDGTLVRFGSSPPFGNAWLDTAGSDEVLVRLSRSVGLPGPTPDILGLAVRVPTGHGPADLLLSTTGLGRLSRRVLVPRRHVDTAYGTLLPYRLGRDLIDLAAERVATRSLPARTPDVPQQLAVRPLELRLLAAPRGEPWRLVGHLHVGGPAAGDLDPDLRFDPVLNTVPGLEPPAWVRDLREPAYAAARRVSRSSG